MGSRIRHLMDALEDRGFLARNTSPARQGTGIAQCAESSGLRVFRPRGVLSSLLLGLAFSEAAFGLQLTAPSATIPPGTTAQSSPHSGQSQQSASPQSSVVSGQTGLDPTYARPNTPDGWLFKFQPLAVPLFWPLLGATAAIVAVWLTNRLARSNESRRDLRTRIELAGNLISLIEAESVFSKKGHYPLGIFNAAFEVPDLTAEEIADWISLEGPLYAGTVSELVDFWGGIYDRSKGFPSPICDIVSFSLWAAGRVAFVAAGARQRGKELSPAELWSAATRIHHLLTALGLAASDLQEELIEYVQSPRRYSKVRWKLAVEEKRMAARLKKMMMRSLSDPWPPSYPSLRG